MVTFHIRLKFVILSSNLSSLHDIKALKRHPLLFIFAPLLLLPVNLRLIFICVTYTCNARYHFIFQHYYLLPYFKNHLLKKISFASFISKIQILITSYYTFNMHHLPQSLYTSNPLLLHNYFLY